MRIVNGVLCVILVLFTAVQYNDPDYLLWGLIYGLGAVFTGLAAFRPALMGLRPVATIYVLCLLGSLGGLYYYWPTTPRWWMEEVWWNTEPAREGMGMMILVGAMLIAGLTVLRTRRA